MKDKRKNIKELAEEIARLEEECQLKHDISKNTKKIEQLVQNLSLEDMLAIDIYIKEKNF